MELLRATRNAKIAAAWGRGAVRRGDWWCEADVPSAGDGTTRVFLAGELFNTEELRRAVDLDAGADEASIALSLTRAHGFAGALARMHGAFTLVRHSADALEIGNDRLGQSFLFYAENPEVISLSLEDFRAPFFEPCPVWARRYLNGDARLSDRTPLAGVLQAGGAAHLHWGPSGLSRRTYAHVRREIAESFAESTRLSEAEVYGEAVTLVTETLRTTARRYGRLQVMLSQGADSLALMALIERAGLDADYHVMSFPDEIPEARATITRIRERFSLGDRVHARAAEGDSLLRGWPALGYDLPLNATWANLAATKHHLLEPAVATGARVFVTGNGGDETFLHRHKYHAAFHLHSGRRARWLARAQRWWGPFASETWERELRRLTPAYYATKPYSYREHEIGPRFFRDFHGEYGGNFFAYLTGERHLARGISFEREYRRAVGRPIVSPFNDFRIWKLMFRLRRSDFIAAMETPRFLDAFDPTGTAALLRANKRANYFPSGRRYPAPPELLEHLREGLALAEGLSEQPHFAAVVEKSLRERALDWEGARLVSYARWREAR